MPSLTFIATFKKNTGILFSAQEIRTSFLYGIKMSSSLSNQINLNFSDEDIEFHVRAAQKEVENYLSLKLFRQIYSETISFNQDDWKSWGFLKTTFQVVCPLRLEGFFNTVKQATYPKEWLSSKKDSSDELYHRSIYLVPAANSGLLTSTAVYVGSLPNLGYLNANMIPNYWTPHYVTGFETIPNDIMQIVGMLATISLLYIAGANVLGTPGISGSSISIDGLSQSLTSSLNAFGERIKAYSEEIQRKLPIMAGTYRGFMWGVL